MNCFQGYEVVLDLDYFETLEEIYDQVTTTLKTHLELHKFEMLLERVKRKKNFIFTMKQWVLYST